MPVSIEILHKGPKEENHHVRKLLGNHMSIDVNGTSDVDRSLARDRLQFLKLAALALPKKLLMLMKRNDLNPKTWQ